MVIHIMRDGTIHHDIRGYVVKRKEAVGIYDLMDRMNKKGNQNEKILNRSVCVR